jgi:cobalt-zinc-cadmium efflux system protein
MSSHTHKHHSASHKDHHVHEHGHGHHHSHSHNAPFKVLVIAILLTVFFALFEAVSGWLAHSLALLSDAGHMASDGVALLIATVAAWITTKPPTVKHSYGMGRAEVIAAWFTSLMMILLSVVVIAEAIKRTHEPEQVHGLTVLIVAGVGLLLNGFIAWMLSRGEKTLNIRAALLHVLGDLLGSVAALIAGAVIIKTAWYPIDSILSILISVLILASSFGLFKESLRILMEGVPLHIPIDQVSESMRQSVGVEAIHDLHIWTLSSGVVALSAHVHIKELSGWHSILVNVQRMLKENFGIDHVTLQPEPEITACKPCEEPK